MPTPALAELGGPVTPNLGAHPRASCIRDPVILTPSAPPEQATSENPVVPRTPPQYLQGTLRPSRYPQMHPSPPPAPETAPNAPKGDPPTPASSLFPLQVPSLARPLALWCGLNHSVVLAPSGAGGREVLGCGCGAGGRLPGWPKGSASFVCLQVEVSLSPLHKSQPLCGGPQDTHPRASHCAGETGIPTPEPAVACGGPGIPTPKPAAIWGAPAYAPQSQLQHRAPKIPEPAALWGPFLPSL